MEKTKQAEPQTEPGMPQTYPTQLFINNKFVDAVGGETFATINPATEKEICQVSRAYAADVDVAVAAAKKALYQGEWKTWDGDQRRDLLNRIANELEANLIEFASIEATDNGKSWMFAKMDLEWAIDVFRYYAGLAQKATGQRFPTKGGSIAYSKQHPIGVVGSIIPWNFPMFMLSWKVGPVLATGCTQVLKPAENTPLSALRFGQILVNCGMPEGVVNIIPGYGHDCGQSMVEHPDIAKIAFTGSTKVGKIINKAATDTLKRVTLECGGKSPNIICDDCNLEKALESAGVGCMLNTGQFCAAGTRVFVQEGIYDAFCEAIQKTCQGYKTAEAFEEGAFLGPLISQTQCDTVMRYIEAGKKEGAKLLMGGNKIDRPGYFVEPTIFADVTEDMLIYKEEIFGPVMTIIKFSTIDEAIEKSNNHQFGLAAGVQTSNINTAMKVSESLRQGAVYVNNFPTIQATLPFGGHRQSGFGRELGEGSLQNYLEHSTIIIQPQI